jgi:hypothetical protein
MKLHTFAPVLLAGGMSVMALAGGAGVAQAQPDINPPPAPGILDFVTGQNPALFVDPQDEGGPGANSDGVGMVCQNLFARCR